MNASTTNNVQNPAFEAPALARKEREFYLRDKKNNIVGPNYTVPNGDFAHFLEYKPMSPEEKSGQSSMSGSRVIEVALRKAIEDVGQGAAEHGMDFRNMFVSYGAFDNQPGRERDAIKSGLDSIAFTEKDTSIDFNKLSTPSALNSMGNNGWVQNLNEFHAKSQESNMRYLYMQYKFDELGKSQSTVSNLMKTRHEAITRAIRDAH